MASGPVIVAADHGGYVLKEAIKRHLKGKGFAVLDVGTHSTDACDYPVFARQAAEGIASGRAWRGVVVDGAGIGSAMAANKIRGVRAGMAFNVATARNAAEHNGAQVLTLGASYLAEDEALRIVDTFLSTECTVDRHLRRVAMIDALEGGAPAPRTTPPRMDQPMAPPSDYELLVDRITKVLAANPGLLGSLDVSASQGVSVACQGDGTCLVCTTQGDCVTLTPDIIQQIRSLAPDGRMSTSLGQQVAPDVASMIDHTLLKADATYEQIDELCAEAKEWGFASVCVNPFYVKRCANLLYGSRSVVCTVIGFPLGATPRHVKALEARQAIREGARELDMVIAIGALKSGDQQAVYDDIRTVAEVVRDQRAILKVIIETSLLTDEEKVTACLLSKKARADFVKTSTGFSTGGATVHDVTLMARAVGEGIGVKASGGVKSVADAHQMIAAGASRIGASVGVKIASEAKSS